MADVIGLGGGVDHRESSHVAAACCVATRRRRRRIAAQAEAVIGALLGLRPELA
eukprot:COSAG06_NODE_841_length_11989_cov_4.537763_17_plen_54_part_00